MSGNCLISVIIPVYNLKPYINKCLSSVVAQTYKNLEIICVDDGSTVGSSDLLDLWAEKDNRIVVIHKVNGGVSSARNAGLDHAKGEYIAFIDGDDYVDKTMYEELYKAAKSNNADIASCSYFYGDERNWKKGKGNAEDYTCDRNSAVEKFLEMKEFFPAVWAKIYHNAVLKNVRFRCDIKISEDRLFNYYAITNCKMMVHICKCLYYYVERHSSALHTINNCNTDSLRVQNLIDANVEKYYPQFKDLSYRLAIIERLNLIYAFFKDNNKIEADELAYSLRKYKKNYLKNRKLKPVFKLLVSLSFVSRKMFYAVLVLLYDKFSK